MNYIIVNRDGLEVRLEIIENNDNEILVRFENTDEVIIITKDDLKGLI